MKIAYELHPIIERLGNISPGTVFWLREPSHPASIFYLRTSAEDTAGIACVQLRTGDLISWPGHTQVVCCPNVQLAKIPPDERKNNDEQD